MAGIWELEGPNAGGSQTLLNEMVEEPTTCTLFFVFTKERD